jgi:uncharacterized membrane protein YdjX (TVP38/TMEM64 family)
MKSGKTPSSLKGSGWKIGVLVVFVLAVAVAFVFGDPKAWLKEAISMVEKLGPWGPLLFMGIFIVAALLMMPGIVLTLGAGALFGVLYGTVMASIASTLAAGAGFLIARYLARDLVVAQTAKYPAFKALDQALKKDGWKIVGLARLSPVLPYSLLNYAFGVTDVAFWPYLFVSWLGMLPGTVVYVYLGSMARAGVTGGSRSPWEWTLYGLGLLATIAVTVLIARRAKKAFHEAKTSHPRKKKAS